jgi:hypothetical protein
MSVNDTSVLKRLETNARQCALDFAEDTHAELGLDVEQDLDIEQTPNWGQSLDYEQGLDVLCLETACAGVLLTLWCELSTYVRSYGVPKAILRAVVECAFLHELDGGLFFVESEEDPEPLSRLQYIKTLERAERTEEARRANAKYPFRVPDDKWRELLAKAKIR